MPNPTMTTFGYPETLVRAYEHWVVLLRRKQVTLGSLVVANSSDATRLGDLSPEAWGEFAAVMSDVEAALASAFVHDKLNALALMMRDPNVHFHVIPRYAGPREFEGRTFLDTAWPGPPDVRVAESLTGDEEGRLIQHLETCWP